MPLGAWRPLTAKSCVGVLLTSVLTLVQTCVVCSVLAVSSSEFSGVNRGLGCSSPLCGFRGFTARHAGALTRAVLRVYVLHGAQVCRLCMHPLLHVRFRIGSPMSVTRAVLRVYVLHGAQASMSTTESVQPQVMGPTALSLC